MIFQAGPLAPSEPRSPASLARRSLARFLPGLERAIARPIFRRNPACLDPCDMTGFQALEKNDIFLAMR
jgi:hypothetical protein